MDKISGLKEILAVDPRNSFARYGLAMEWVNQGDTDQALGEFDQLLAADPGYTAAYFMAAQTLANVGRREDARQRLEAGIVSAKCANNQHAISEMQAMLDELSV